MEHATSNGGRIPVRLELDRGADPISGRLTDPDGTGEEFVGWLALSAALERRITGSEGGPRSRSSHAD